MLNTILCKRTALPLGLLSLSLVLPSCGSSEYKKYADNQAKQAASILPRERMHAVSPARRRLLLLSAIFPDRPTVKADMRKFVRVIWI
ncbi:MAG: hypothetical protein ACLR6J_13955 [Parabacteroides merdae]